MKPVKHIFLLLLFVLALPDVSPAASTNDTPAWQLLPAVKVDSAGIFLNEVLAADPQLVLPQIRLAPAPALGQTVSFSRAQILELARRRVAEIGATNWTGAGQVRITRRTRQLTDLELTDLLTKTLQADNIRDRGELELHLSRPWMPALVPDEPLTLKIIELPAAGVSPNFVVSFELWNGKESAGSWQLAVQARVWREIPVAHSPLNRGQLLREADVTLERRDVLVQRDAFMGFPTEDASLELVEHIAEGLPVLNRSVRPRPVIRRGRVVEAVYQDGSLSISLKVEALEDGLLGQTVRVRNPKTRRELYGKVQNEQTILIAL